MIARNWQKNLLFWSILLLLFLVYAYQEILFFRPHSMHNWRQADCISLSQNFIEEKNPFQPSIHNYISDHDTSGKSAGEFTGVYYLMGRIWEFTGVQHWIYRLFNILMMSFACFSLYKTLQLLWKDTFWSLFLSLLLFASPLIVYYTPNFLTDITALALTVWGWSLYVRYSIEGKRKQLIAAFVLFTFAALLKITAAITVLSLLAVVGLEALGCWKHSTYRTAKPWRTVAIGAVALLVVFGWYYYASVYNGKHGGKYTFNDLWPIWDLKPENYAAATKYFRVFMQNEFAQSVLRITVVLLSAAGLILAFRRFSRMAVVILVAMTGSTLYLLFWFGALEGHDYYFINLMMLPLLMTGVFIHYRHFLGRRFNIALKIFCGLAFALSVVFSASGIRMRYSEQLKFSRSLAEKLYSGEEIGFWTWMSLTYQNRGLFTMEPYNRKLGIKKEDLVVVLPDPSFNIGLTRLNQKGWSDYNYGPGTDLSGFRRLVENGAKYLIINKFEFKTFDTIAPAVKDSIGFYEGYTVYRL